ncbi:MAG: aldo/keto reductase [Mucilaginibacter polytrichastri]|nr:aldo/keto reductase [Mucilaginibacter polytrichastri]
MQYRKLGNSDLQVAPLALGTNVFGWTADEPTSHKLLDAFVDAGFNLLDTADVYSGWVPGNTGGESETIIGNWIRKSGKRDKVLVATKVGKPMGEGKKGLSKKYIHEAVDASLRRLQTDYIDLYQSHDDDKDTPFTETLEAYGELIKAGKVRVIGASNYSAERLAEALQVSAANNLPRYETLQPEYNLYDREGFENGLQPLAKKENLSVIPYYSLASGFLSGKYRSEADLNKSQRGGGIKKYLDKKGMNILGALDEVAGKYGVKQAQVALAWLAAQPAIAAPIASATSLEQLSEITKAVEVQLDEESLDLLNQTENV